MFDNSNAVLLADLYDMTKNPLCDMNSLSEKLESWLNSSVNRLYVNRPAPSAVIRSILRNKTSKSPFDFAYTEGENPLVSQNAHVIASTTFVLVTESKISKKLLKESPAPYNYRSLFDGEKNVTDKIIIKFEDLAKNMVLSHPEYNQISFMCSAGNLRSVNRKYLMNLMNFWECNELEILVDNKTMIGKSHIGLMYFHHGNDRAVVAPLREN